jgi:ribosome modulation factor
MAVAAKKYERTIADDDRSATGKGWEARRNGLDESANPYEPETWQFKHWLSGWKKFKKPGSSLSCSES